MLDRKTIRQDVGRKQRPRQRSWTVRLVAGLTAGVLFQAAGCQLSDPNTLVGGLAVSVADSFVTNYVNELFGVGGFSSF